MLAFYNIISYNFNDILLRLISEFHYYNPLTVQWISDTNLISNKSGRFCLTIRRVFFGSDIPQ